LLARATCAGEQTCGWTDEAAGFRCRPSRESGCSERDSWGSCHDGEAAFCDGGVLRSVRCDGCAERCLRRPDTGRVSCEST
jgi:hypothetical protein